MILQTKSITKRIAAVTLSAILLAGVVFVQPATATESNEPVQKDVQSVDSVEELVKVTPEADELTDATFSTKRLIVTSETDQFNHHGAETVTSYGTMHVLSFDDESCTRDAYLALKSEPGVDSVEIDSVLEVSEDIPADVETTITKDSDLAKYIKSKTQSKDVIVAIIDSGIDMDAVDKSRVAGYLNFDGSLEDNRGHGTTIAKIILDSTESNVSIYPIKVTDDDGKTSLLNIVAAIESATNSEVDVINISMNSLKTTGASKLIQSAIEKAKNRGIKVVVSAGNEHAKTTNYIPSDMEDAYVISATDENKNFADYSNYGSTVDYATYGIYNNTSGTSISAAYFSGIAANIIGMNEDVDTVLSDYTEKLGSKDQYGVGFVSLGVSNEISEQKTQNENAKEDEIYVDKSSNIVFHSARFMNYDSIDELTDKEISKIWSYSTEEEKAWVLQNSTDQQKKRMKDIPEIEEDLSQTLSWSKYLGDDFEYFKTVECTDEECEHEESEHLVPIYTFEDYYEKLIDLTNFNLSYDKVYWKTSSGYYYEKADGYDSVRINVSITSNEQVAYYNSNVAFKITSISGGKGLVHVTNATPKYSTLQEDNEGYYTLATINLTWTTSCKKVGKVNDYANGDVAGSGWQNLSSASDGSSITAQVGNFGIDRWNGNSVVCDGYNSTFVHSVSQGSHTFIKNENSNTLKSKATCTTAAKYVKTCKYCGTADSTAYASGSALGHSYGSWTTVKAATCTTKGSKKRTCSRCKSVDTQEIAATGHDDGEWVVTKAATCTTKGTKELQCTKCKKALKTQTIAATGHTCTYTVSGSTITATCDTCKKTIGTITLSNKTVTYNGLAQTVDITKTGTINGSGAFVSGTQINAGTYRYEFTATDDHKNKKTISATLTINKAGIEMNECKIIKGLYWAKNVNSDTFAVFESDFVPKKGGTAYYNLVKQGDALDEKNWTTKSPILKANDSGVYDVYYKVVPENDNYKAIDSTKVGTIQWNK